MASSNTETKNQKPRSYLKMKALVDATGVAKSTILLYVKEGLLPRPVKTSPNMAYYPPDCVQRIAFIKEVQSVHRLPLAAIKGLLKEMDKGRDITPMIALQSTLFKSPSKKMGTRAFSRATGLSGDELARLCDMELIIPLEPGKFDSQDLGLAKQLAAWMGRGLDLDMLAFYPQIAKEMVAAEINLRETVTRDMAFEENARVTLEMTQLARGLRAYVIDRTLQAQLLRFNGLKKRESPKK